MVLQGELLDGRLLEPLAASGGAVGLGNDTDYLMLGDEHLQRWHREIGRTHKDNPGHNQPQPEMLV
jgi:hypothetical protein